jgi:hypothetical protein
MCFRHSTDLYPAAQITFVSSTATSDREVLSSADIIADPLRFIFEQGWFFGPSAHAEHEYLTPILCFG